MYHKRRFGFPDAKIHPGDSRLPNIQKLASLAETEVRKLFNSDEKRVLYWHEKSIGPRRKEFDFVINTGMKLIVGEVKTLANTEAADIRWAKAKGQMEKPIKILSTQYPIICRVIVCVFIYGSGEICTLNVDETQDLDTYLFPAEVLVKDQKLIELARYEYENTDLKTAVHV